MQDYQDYYCHKDLLDISSVNIENIEISKLNANSVLSYRVGGALEHTDRAGPVISQYLLS